MRQRAMIAMAIANDPDVLIADEPTTALDVTIQAQVLEVLERIQDRTKSAIMLITHDLGVVAGVADRVLVMYAGRQVEIGSVDEIFYEPRHPYTRGPARVAAAARPRARRRAAAPHQGPAAVADPRAAGLRVPSAVPGRADVAGRVRRRIGPSCARSSARPRVGVPLRGRRSTSVDARADARRSTDGARRRDRRSASRSSRSTTW